MSSSRPQPRHSSSSFGNGSTASTILGAFGRRPRTANSRDRQSPVAAGTNYGESTEDLSPTPSRNRFSPSSRSGLPRSSSSSHVHRVPTEGAHRFAFPSSNSGDGARRPSVTTQSSIVSLGNRPQTSGEDSALSHGGPGFPSMTRTTSSQGAGNGGSALGRYFRRYSQGAGKNMAAANEAHAIAAASHAAAANEGGPGESGSGSTSNPLGGYALPVSHSQAALPVGGAASVAGTAVSNLHDAQGLSGTEGAAASLALMNGSTDANSSATSTAALPLAASSSSSSHRIRLVPHLEATRSLHFEPIERDLVEGAIAVKIGRFTDRINPGAGANASGMDGAAFGGASVVNGLSTGNNSALTTSGSSGGVPGARGGAIPSSAGGGGRVDSSRIAFKSKVVSRGHAEVWCETGGKFFIRDTKSSSGTFLNHIRLSHPNIESKPFPLKDGDVVQLGVDYQGGTEEIYRCVKMRVELNRGWQRGANQFNVNALRQLRALQGSPLPETGSVAGKATGALPTNRQSMNVTDCCICLFSVTVCQALFIAPCSHVFHFKCIRPLIEQHHPGFCCPLCRTFADLDADVEEDEAWQQALLQQAGGGHDANAGSVDASTPTREEPNPARTQAAAVLQATAAVEAASANNSPRTPSSLRRSIHRNGSVDEGEPSVESARRRSSASNASPSSRRGSEQQQQQQQQQYNNRPDTAVSSATAVPPPSFNAGHALRNVVTPPQDSHQRAPDEREEEDEEVMYEDHSLSGAAQSRRPSAPINISNSSIPMAAHSHRRTPSNDGFVASPSFNDARTPMNDHFLSTLAEAPPPSRHAVRAIEPSGDNTLFPTSSLVADRRVSSATNNSSLLSGEGNGDVYSTPGQGNSPAGKLLSLSAVTARSAAEEDGSGEASTSSTQAHASSTTASASRSKSPEETVPNHLQGAIDFLAREPRSQEYSGSLEAIQPASAARRPREHSMVESVASSERGSSGQRSQSSREASSASGKVARFFKRTSSAVGN